MSSARLAGALVVALLLSACAPTGSAPRTTGLQATSLPASAPDLATSSPAALDAADPSSSPPARPVDPEGAPGMGLGELTMLAPWVPAPEPTVVAPTLPPPTKPYALNLYAPGDFVAQYTFEWCVGASIQMTLNLVTARTNRTRSLQQRLWEQARDLSNSPFGGANPVGWTGALNQVGVGTYALASEPDLVTAIRTAARAIRQTERPVGLVMWAGRHAWVMSGFSGLGDPAITPNFEVTGVRVLDPLYPYGSDTWGPSPRPNTLLTLEQLGSQFVARPWGRTDFGVEPGYLLVLPIPI